MGCIQAPDRNFKEGTGGTHKWVLYVQRQGTPMNEQDARHLPSWAVREWETDLYRCEYCGEIEAMQRREETKLNFALS